MITDTNHQELLWDEWQEKFRPIRNRIAKTEVGYDNTLFETYGEENEYVNKVMAESPYRIWTLVTNDFGKDVIVEGWHWVNRMGYFITEIPFDETMTYSVYWDEEDRDYDGTYEIAEEHHVCFSDWVYRVYSQCGAHACYEVLDQLHNWKNNQGTLQDILDALDEADDDWQESWETYLEAYLNQRI